MRHEIAKICESFLIRFCFQICVMLSFFRGLYSGFMLQKLQTPESDTLVFRKYYLFQYFSKINYGSYLHAVSLWVSSELYRVFVLVFKSNQIYLHANKVLLSYFSVFFFGSMWHIRLAVISAFHRISIRIPYLNLVVSSTR